MYAKKFEDISSELMYETAEYRWILPREVTKNRDFQIAMARIKENSKMIEKAHNDREEIYIILEGEGVIKVGDEEKKINKGMIVYIPINAVHVLRCSEGCKEIVYILVVNWA